MYGNYGINKLLIHEPFLCTEKITFYPSQIHSVSTGFIWALKAFFGLCALRGALVGFA